MSTPSTSMQKYSLVAEECFQSVCDAAVKKAEKAEVSTQDDIKRVGEKIIKQAVIQFEQVMQSVDRDPSLADVPHECLDNFKLLFQESTISQRLRGLGTDALPFEIKTILQDKLDERFETTPTES